MVENRENKAGNKDTFFKGQLANEEMVCFFRKHWVTMLPYFGFLLFIILIESSLILFFPQISHIVKGNTAFTVFFVGLILVGTIYLHKVFSEIFKHFMCVTIFTNSRVIEHRKSLFLHDDSEILDLVKVQDVKKSQDGILRNILRYGDLTITLSSSEASKLIRYVPNVSFHARCLARIKKDAFWQNRFDGARANERYPLYEPVGNELRQISQEIQNILSPKV